MLNLEKLGYLENLDKLKNFKINIFVLTAIVSFRGMH